MIYIWMCVCECVYDYVHTKKYGRRGKAGECIILSYNIEITNESLDQVEAISLWEVF